MAYAYIGPELARLNNYKFQVQEERDKYARRAKKDKIITLGSAAVLAASTLIGWGLTAGLASSGVERFDASFPDPVAIGLTLWATSFPVSMVAGSIALPFWIYNASRVQEKNSSLAQISEDIKRVQKGSL